MVAVAARKLSWPLCSGSCMPFTTHMELSLSISAWHFYSRVRTVMLSGKACRARSDGMNAWHAVDTHTFWDVLWTACDSARKKATNAASMLLTPGLLGPAGEVTAAMVQACTAACRCTCARCGLTAGKRGALHSWEDLWTGARPVNRSIVGSSGILMSRIGNE